MKEETLGRIPLPRNREGGVRSAVTAIEGYTKAFPDADDEALATHLDIASTSAMFGRAIEALIQELGFELSRPRYSIVRLLYLSTDNALPQSEIAQALRVSGPNVTQLIDALVADGWVERVMSPVDKRVTYARLSDEGKNRASQLVPAVVQFMVHSCSNLNSEERSELRRLLGKVRAAVEGVSEAP